MDSRKSLNSIIRNKSGVIMAGGRPTKYNQGVLDKTADYLENFETYGDVFPSIIGLSLVLDVSDDTIQNWRKQANKKEFFGMLEKIHKKQHQVLLNKGITGEFNSNICKLVLTKHGYSDKQDNTHAGIDGGAVKIENTCFEFIEPEKKS